MKNKLTGFGGLSQPREKIKKRAAARAVVAYAKAHTSKGASRG